uniref:Type I restriction endonuclease subunit R n=1 Tax=Desulfobacca acetoxidans TaxID=60893 RepID=A0A7V4G6J3_9BACT
MDISEKNFEAAIEEGLIARGYRKRRPEDFDRTLCLDPEAVLDFIYATQPKEWEKLKKQHGAEVKERFLQRLSKEVARRGTLDVLRKGIKDSGCTFKMAYFQPVSGLNPDLQKLYQANQFTLIRQLRFSEKTEQSLDLGLFLNGLPIFTAELKNPLTGQNVQDAIRQYRFERNPKEPFFALGRCLAHFAVDPDLVYLTTRLEGPKTRFLPFNQGRNGGAGNPPSWQGFATAYLWEDIWSRDSVLNLIQHFVHIVEVEDDKGRKTGERRVIFPRYHQLESVRRLVAAARQEGAGHHYLIQHSAGSGKSNSIAWLAHQLSVLHDDQDKRVFDSIIVITDRRVLDRQIQRTVRQFELTPGVVENIDKTSRQLKEALESGKTIIVTTLQKFPVIADQMGALPGKRFAVIVDEAHSSQTGESTKSLKAVLAVGSLEEAEQEEGGEPEDLEDLIAAEMKKRGRLPNVSTFAFTATPKPKTLELFGTRREDGKFEPFSLYSMRQAIEENFIMDVLQNYTTYKAYWNLLKKIKDDPHYDRRKATYLLKAFVDLHEHTIAKKVEIMMYHFAGQVASRIGGRAKAMIVTRSRLHAVRYKLEVDKYLKERGLPYKALVAFSGTVRDGGQDYTEAGMNGFPDTQTAKTFERPEYRFLIVAEKFQTGFDQPLLHTMYVDRKLAGVHAVQTLSRLNRVRPGKEETVVLDFANEAEAIKEAFEPYYDRILLSEATDPNLLYDLQTRLANFQFYTQAEIDRFAQIYFNPKATQDKLHAALAPAVDRFHDATKEEQVDFRGQLNDYVRLYAFLSQVITFFDPDLEKLYVFGRFLLRKCVIEGEPLPKEVLQAIDMESYRLAQTRKGKIKLERGTTEVEPIGPKAHQPAPNEKEALSRIIQELNERFGTDFSEEDRVFIQQLEERLAADPGLEASVKVNPPENARLTFDHVLNDRVQEMIDANFKFYKQINDDPEFGKFFSDWLFDRYLRSKKANAP